MSIAVIRYLIISLFLSLLEVGSAYAAKLSLEDKVSRWPRATTDEKFEFATRMGSAFSSLLPDLDKNYFIKCLEETANIGNPGEIKLEEAVKLCVSVKKDGTE